MEKIFETAKYFVKLSGHYSTIVDKFKKPMAHLLWCILLLRSEENIGLELESVAECDILFRTKVGSTYYHADAFFSTFVTTRRQFSGTLTEGARVLLR